MPNHPQWRHVLDMTVGLVKGKFAIRIRDKLRNGNDVKCKFRNIYIYKTFYNHWFSESLTQPVYLARTVRPLGRITETCFIKWKVVKRERSWVTWSVASLSSIQVAKLEVWFPEIESSCWVVDSPALPEWIWLTECEGLILDCCIAVINCCSCSGPICTPELCPRCWVSWLKECRSAVLQ